MSQKSQVLRPALQALKINEKGAQLRLMNVRAAFVKLAEPSTPSWVERDKAGNAVSGTYELTLLIPKTEKKFLPALDKIVMQALKVSKVFEKATDVQKVHKNAMRVGAEGSLVKDGDDTTNSEGKVYAGFEGHYTMKVKTAAHLKNGVFEPRVEFQLKYKDNTDVPKHMIAEEFYSGAWVDVAFNLKPYKFGPNKGMTMYLMGVMKIKDDKRLGGADLFDVRDDIEDNEEEVPMGAGFKDDEDDF